MSNNPCIHRCFRNFRFLICGYLRKDRFFFNNSRNLHKQSERVHVRIHNSSHDDELLSNLNTKVLHLFEKPPIKAQEIIKIRKFANYFGNNPYICTVKLVIDDEY